MRKAIQLICVLLVVAMLAVPVFAAGSVEQKGAPVAITPSAEQKGAPAAAEKDVAVTALVDLDKAPAEVKKVVEEAYKVIADAESLVKAVPAVETALKEMKADVKAENLIVRDLFYLELDKELAEGEEKAITFKAEGIEKGDFLMVMVYVDGEWVVLDADKVEINEDGTVKVTFNVVGPVAFIAEK